MSNYVEYNRMPAFELSRRREVGAGRRAAYAPLDPANKYDTGISAAIYEGIQQFEQNPKQAQEYYRSNNQGWATQLATGFASRALSVVPKIGQGFANVAGFIASPFLDGGLQEAYNNSVARSFEQMDESLREALPIYKSQTYAEGNFLQKALTTSFWADDGFDGIAYLGSAIVPGVVIGRAGSILGAASKIKAAKGITDTLSKAGKSLGINQTAALTGLYNTVSEAGVEARETQKLIEQELAMAKGYGDISEASAKEQEEIKLAAAERASQTFWWNTVALTAPNIFQSKLFFKGATDGLDDIRKSVRYGGKKLEDFKTGPMEYAKKVGQSAAIEGLWEENIQMSVQQYEKRKALGETDLDAVTGPLINLINNGWAFSKSVLSLGMFGTQAHTDEDEAAGAILLGALIGGGSALATTYSEAKRKQQLAKQEIDLWDKFKNLSNAAKDLAVENNKSFLKVFGSREEVGKDDAGNEVKVDVPVYVNPTTGKSEVDPQKLATILARSNTNALNVQESMSATAVGDNVWKEYADRDALFSYVNTLARAGAVSREDFVDLIKTDPVINGKLAEEFGIKNVIRDNEALAMQYYDTMQDVKKTYARPDDLSSPEDVGFANTYYRVLSRLK
jgi:hypothetical protein